MPTAQKSLPYCVLFIGRMDVFYDEIAADAVRGPSDLDGRFETLISLIMLDDTLRPIQKLALVYERNREF